ncbi:MAG: zinc metallopeptidase, partial [bacterium]|nr:zinc metallopeptidase [bacterium]
MRWQGRSGSTNVSDRRGMSGGGMALGGGSLVILLIAMLMGADPRQLLEQMGSAGMGGGTATQEQYVPTPHEEELKEFSEVVLKDTEDVWNAIFQKQGNDYQEPTMVLFSGQVQSACGHASAAVGPFYCPGDSDVYLDLSFFDQLNSQFGAAGDFAQAYVIAHEVGHHVQHQLGIAQKVDSMRGKVSQAEMNKLSVRLELQADFFAGVWAHHADKTLGVVEPGDIEEALTAATAIGDDRLQQQQQGHVVPDSFTHG